MSIDITNPGVAGITVESDPTAVKKAGDTMSGTLYLPTARNLLNADLNIVAYNDTGAGTTYTHAFNPWNGTFQLATNGGGLRFPDSTYQATAGLPLTGGTLSGKVTLASIGVASPSLNLGAQCDVAPTNVLNGDLWITNAASPKLAYRMGGVTYQLPVSNLFNTFSGQNVFDTTSSIAAVRITQRGTGNALEVEDSSPDTNALIVNASGDVGVGVANNFTPTQKFEVVGNVKATALVTGSGPAFTVNGTQTHSGGADTHELLLSVNGSTYRIGMRFVSTP